LDLAKRMGTRSQRLNAVEAGRDEASDEFLQRLAREIGFRYEQVVAAYLEGRRTHLLAETRAVKMRLVDIRTVGRRRRAS
jgi:transcriptional regulator with XRE-family HTH domain